MNQAIIKLDNKSFILKQSFRSLMEFETMTGKNSFELKISVNDSLTLFYCMLKVSNRETFNYTLDAFLDLLDETPGAVNEFNKFVTGLAQALGMSEKAVTSKKKAEKR